MYRVYGAPNVTFSPPACRLHAPLTRIVSKPGRSRIRENGLYGTASMANRNRSFTVWTDTRLTWKQGNEQPQQTLAGGVCRSRGTGRIRTPPFFLSHSCERSVPHEVTIPKDHVWRPFPYSHFPLGADLRGRQPVRWRPRHWGKPVRTQQVSPMPAGGALA